MSSFARPVRSSSAKAELSSHLAQGSETTAPDILFALVEGLQEFLVLEDLHCLLEGLLLLGRHEHGSRAAVPGDHDVLVP
jgi:hypothetical protein